MTSNVFKSPTLLFEKINKAINDNKNYHNVDILSFSSM